MATIASGNGRRQRRVMNHDLPLVPFIDFLICLVVFLLAQAGFANLGRLPGNASLSRPGSELPETPSKRLHLDVHEQFFRVTWRSGATVVATHDVPAHPVLEEHGVRRYPELSRFLDADFRENGAHQSATDPLLDEAVIHVQNEAAYEDLIAVLDALRAPRRAVPGSRLASAFALSLASD